MQLCFSNGYSSPLSVAVMWYSPDTCGGDGGNWETRGWWNLNPGDNVTTNVSTDNEYFYFYAEAWDGACVGGGPYGAQVSIYAFDGCIDIGTIVQDGDNPYFDVGFQQVDAGFGPGHSSYTVNLT